MIVLTIPFWLIISNLSSAVNSPIKSPLSSTFNLWTVSSNQILLGFKVEIPFSFNSILLMENFVTVLPRLPLPLIARSAKSISHFSFFVLPTALKLMVTTSASPFGFAVKYSTFEFLYPVVRSYSLSLVIEVTENLFIKVEPVLPSL